MLIPINSTRQPIKPIFSSQSYLESLLAFCDLCFDLIDTRKEFYFICKSCDNFAACLTCVKNPKHHLIPHSSDHVFYADKPYSNKHWTHRNLMITCNVCDDKHFFGQHYQCRQCFDYNVCSNCLNHSRQTHYLSEKHVFDFVPNPTKLHCNRHLLAERTKQVLRHRNADVGDRDQTTGWTMDEATIISEQALKNFTAMWKKASEIFKEEDIDLPPNIIEHEKLAIPLITIANK